MATECVFPELERPKPSLPDYFHSL